MPTPLPTSGLHVKLGYTGTGDMSAGGGTALTSVGFTALPWQGSGTPLSAADIGAQISVIGAGPNMPFVPAFGPAGKMLVSTVVSVTNGANCHLANAASNTTQPGAANVVIYRPVSCKEGSIKISWNITSIARSTLTFTVESRDGSMIATAGMPVLVYDDTLLGVMWGGSIQSVKCTNATAIPGDMLIFEVTCNSWAVLLDRRIISPYILTGGVFSSMTLKDIAESLVYDYCDSEGLEVNSVTGPTIDLDVSGKADKSVAQGLDAATLKCNDATHAYVWYVSPWKIVTLIEATTNTAPWHISDLDGSETAVLVGLEYDTSRDKLANHVYLEAGIVLGPSTSEPFVGDGSTSDWSVTSPIGAIPALTVNGVTQTVGLKNGTTSFQWYWILGSNTIVRGTHAVLTSAQTLLVTYRPASTQMYVGRDATAINTAAAIESGTGQWDTKQTYNNPIESADGQATADSATAQFSQLPKSLQFDTYKPLLDVAQLMTITLGQFVLSGINFLIDAIDLDTSENVLKWTVHCVNGPVVGDYVTAFIALTSPGSLASGSLGSSSTTPVEPAAPNITSATAAPVYSLSGNTSVFGFAGVITLPTTDPAYGHLAQILVEAIKPGATGGTIIARILAAAFGASTVAYAGGQFTQSGTGTTWSLRFTALDELGLATAPPVTVTGVAVNASAITAVTGAEHSSSRYADPTTRLVHLLVDITPTIAASQVPQSVMYWVSSDNGVTYVPIGWAYITTVGQVIQCDRLAPGANQTWKVAAATGVINYVGGVAVPAASLPAGAVISAGFTVLGLAVPGASNGITATIDTATAAKYTSDGTAYGYVAPISYTDPTGSSTDFFVRVTVQDYDSGGSSLGPEKPHMGTQITGAGNTHTNDGPLLVTYYTGLHHIKVRFYVANRVSQSAGDFTDTATNTLQSVAFNGGSPASSFDIGVTIPAGALDLSRSDATTLLDGLTKQTTGIKLATSNLSNMCMNPGFEDGVNGTTDIPHWTGSGTYSLLTNPVAYSGNNVLLINGTSQVFGDFIAVRPGDVLYLEGYVQFQYASGSPGGSIDITLPTYDAAGSLVSFIPAAGYPSASAAGVLNTWTKIFAIATVPAGISSVRVRIQAGSITGVGAFFVVDNIFVCKQIPTGPGTEPDGNGGVKVKFDLAGPIYADVSNNVAIRLAGDFTVAGSPPKLTQLTIDLAKSVNFDTTDFQVTGGALVVKNIAVNKLIAGNALFTGVATFAYSGGGKVTIDSGGITLADSNTSPTSTVTIASTGMTIAKTGGGSVQVTSTGVSITLSSSFVVADSTGISIGKTGFSTMSLTSTGITITEPGGAQLLASGSQISLVKGSNSVVATASDVTINTGGSTVTINGSQMTANSVQVQDLVTTRSLSINVSGGNSIIIASASLFASTATAGAITPPSQVVGYVIFKNGSLVIGKIPYYAN